MATCTRRLPPPPPPAPRSAITHLGKKRGSWLPEPEKEMPVACLPTAKTGKEKVSWLLPKPELEKEKPLTRLAPAIAPGDLANPVKKKRYPVPMTDEDRNKIKRLKEMHRSAVKELQELREERDELRKNYDEFLFWRRCIAARLVNRIVFQHRDAAYVSHQLNIGLKVGDKLPEELKKAWRPVSKALFMWRDMGRALQLGMDRFIAEYSNPQECKKRIRREWNALAGIDENGAPLGSVDQK